MPEQSSSAAAAEHSSIGDFVQILVTRPEPDAEKTAARLRALGHEPLIAPLLSVITAPMPADLPEPAALILTSRNAVRAISSWPQASAWCDRPVFVTGRGTADGARRSGFTDIRSAAGDAADLGTLLTSSIEPEIGPILYPAARDRSEAFLRRLHAAGYDIRVVVAYHAEAVETLEPAICDAFRFSRIGAVLLYSRRTAEAFRHAVERAGLIRAVPATKFCVLSAQVAEPVADLGAEIAVAQKPDEDSLLALLETFPG